VRDVRVAGRLAARWSSADLSLGHGLRCLPEPELPASQAIGSGIDVDTEGPASELLYLTGAWCSRSREQVRSTAYPGVSGRTRSSWLRAEIPSLAKTLRRWYCTVCALM
jgi:hypothetical protein